MFQRSEINVSAAEVHPREDCRVKQVASDRLYRRFAPLPGASQTVQPGVLASQSSSSLRAAVSRLANDGAPSVPMPTLPRKVLDQLEGIPLGSQMSCFLSESLSVAATLEVSIASVKEAARSLAWLEASHPDWWPSCILDADVRRDVRMTALAREGARAVSSARLAVASYDSFVSSKPGLTRAGACDVDVLHLYFHG